MAGSKDAVLLASLIVLVGSGAALDFQVNVAPTPEAKTYAPNSSFADYFNATVNIENPGSVGCSFRIKGDIRQGEQRITRYSSSYNMWPGDLQLAEFIYLPLNYSGTVNADLSLVYCDMEKELEDFSFDINRTVVPNSTIDSKTLEVNRTNAVAAIDVKRALLIPQQYPAYWKVGSVRAEDGRAVIEYEPTLFRKGESIVYTVVTNGTIEGTTEIVLEDQQTWYEEILSDLQAMF